MHPMHSMHSMHSDAPDAPFSSDEHRLTGLDLVAGLDADFFDLTGDVRRHLDRRLVGFELEHRLIDGHGVTRLDQHFQDVTLGDAVAQVWEDELAH